MARPTKTKQLLKQAGELPQSDAVWECTVRKAPAWYETRSGDLMRAAMILVAEEATSYIRFVDTPKGQPNADSAIAGLLKAMLEPNGSEYLPDAGQTRAERPARVKLDWLARLEDVQKALGEIGVAVEPADDLPVCEDVYQQLLQYMNPGPRPSAICRIAPSSPELTREFFDASDSFYRAAAWKYVYNDDVIEVRYGNEPARYCAIMGNGGEEFGIVLYHSLEDVADVLSSGNPFAMRRGMIWLTTSYDDASAVAIEDVDYMEKQRIQPADYMAFPMFVRVRMPMSFESPDVIDLKITVAALRVLPQFVVASMMAGEGEPQPAGATMALPELHEGATLSLKWPVEGLEDRIEQRMDEREAAGEIGPMSNDEAMHDFLNGLETGDDIDFDDDDIDEAEEEADAMEAEIIAMAEQLEAGAGKLIQAINSVMPAVSFKAEQDVIDRIKPKPRGMKAGVFYETFTSMYSDPRVGILICFVLPKSETPIVIPLTFLDVDPSHPLADAITRYQQSRSAKK
jgi:hypothetical protein